jgi:DNA processing protein
VSAHVPDDRRELAARLALLAVPGLKPERIIEIITDAGSAVAACNSIEALCGPEIAAAARSDSVRERTRRALHAVEQQELHVVTFDDVAYPQLLTQHVREYRPPVLFGRGDLSLLDMTGVAVVGSRTASQYGLDVAGDLADAVVRAGGCVISGLALGIDAAAHQAALDGDGPTIGVLGCGVDVMYPRRNMELQCRIAVSGLLLSELLPGEPPRKYQFPWRNRIIAALSKVVVVAEAGETSGALITAGHAIDYDIYTFAVPNAIDRPNSAGILRLFGMGVHPYLGPRDTLQMAGLIGVADPVPARPERPVEHAPADPTAAMVWLSLGGRGRHVDRIAAETSLSAAEALTVLADLELDGFATQLVGSRFVRRPPIRDDERNRKGAAG